MDDEKKLAYRKKILDDLNYVSQWPLDLLFETMTFKVGEDGLTDFQRAIQNDVGARYRERFGDDDSYIPFVRERVLRSIDPQDWHIEKLRGKSGKERQQKYDKFGAPIPPKEIQTAKISALDSFFS